MNYIRGINCYFSSITASLLMTVAAYGQGEPREWRSRDGRAIQASGIGATLEGVMLARTDGSRISIPYSSLHPDDAKWAVQNLKAHISDQVEVSALTKSQSFNRFERGTGDYALRLDIYKINSGLYQASGSATEIMEKVKESGRTVTIELSPPLGVKHGGAVAVELYTIKGQGSSKEVADVSAGVFQFGPDGSIVMMNTKVIEGYSGWAVLVRSLNTGKIIASSATMNHFSDFVVSEAAEAIDFSKARRKIMDAILAKL